MFTIKIETGNAAFNGTGEAAGVEIARILRQFSERIVGHGNGADYTWALFDVNGNRVGEAEYKAERV